MNDGDKIGSCSGPLAGITDPLGLAQAIVDTIREPLLVLDADLRVVAASRSFYLKFNLLQADVEGKAVYALAGGQWNIPELKLLLERILPRQTSMEAYEVEPTFTGIGKRSMLLNARKVFYEEGNANALILLAIEDVTDRRAIERHLADLLAQKETLLIEMQHRVANSLQIIASILSLKAQTVDSEEIRGHLQDAHRRVLSVATVQQQLNASRHLEHIEVGPYLTRLCDALAASMIGDTRPITMKVLVDQGTASSNQAVSIGLIVTELVINSLKHAFVGARRGGQIVVSYEAANAGWKLVVADNGVGKPAGAPDKAPEAGLGTSIVEALSKQLDGRVIMSMTPQGTTVSVVNGSFSTSLPAAA